MVNQDLLNRLISLIKQNIITVDDIINIDYKTAVQTALNTPA
ncbi:hypothetical protein AB8U03_13625 [Clostridium sp. Mt-5]|uniref:Uncharacterized protein n=1 Tax=Clostridium moutaii TaxID=3240932 RepID=A0ABV4BU16_9CLOT